MIIATVNWLQKLYHINLSHFSYINSYFSVWLLHIKEEQNVWIRHSVSDKSQENSEVKTREKKKKANISLWIQKIKPLCAPRKMSGKKYWHFVLILLESKFLDISNVKVEKVNLFSIFQLGWADRKTVGDLRIRQRQHRWSGNSFGLLQLMRKGLEKIRQVRQIQIHPKSGSWGKWKVQSDVVVLGWRKSIHHSWSCQCSLLC